MTLEELIKSNKNQNVKWIIDSEETSDINELQKNLWKRSVNNWTVDQWAGIIYVSLKPEMKHEIDSMLTVSTAHIKAETAKLLEDESIEGVTVYKKDIYGWFIYIDINNSGISETNLVDLNNIIHFALDQGCSIICIDRDGDTIDGLAVYEW